MEVEELRNKEKQEIIQMVLGLRMLRKSSTKSLIVSNIPCSLIKFFNPVFQQC